MGAQATTIRAERTGALGNAYSAAFEAAGEAMLLFAGVFVDCNPRALAVFGSSREQMLGRKPEDFFPDIQPDGKNSRQAAAEYSARAAAGETVTYRFQFRRLDGTLF